MREGKVHFIGAGGYGMRPLAAILLSMGRPVSGSDIKDSEGLSELRSLGAEVWVGHDAARLASASRVVYSNAVPQDDPELVEARRLGIEVLQRAELLAELFNATKGIGVTGTHGKTTTTALLTYMFIEAGWDPMALVGSGLYDMPTGGRLGKGGYMVVEADEAYGTFLRLKPFAAVITNVDDDHRDHYGTYDAIKEAFARYSSQVRADGIIAVCTDSEDAVAASKAASARIAAYGLKEKDGYSARDIRPSGLGASFILTKAGEDVTEMHLNVPGSHNVLNAVGAAALALELGMPASAVRDGASAYRGADRRCQKVADTAGVLVIDDYAHHPEEVKATLAALRQITAGRLIAVFQPQRFTRTKLLMDRFAKAFMDADELLVTEIYSKGTGESPIEGVSGEVLARAIASERGRDVATAAEPAEAAVWALGLAAPGDTVVTMGAGDIWKASRMVAEGLAQRDGR